MMVWIAIFFVYEAPPNAVDWDGPWKIGITHVSEEHYSSEAKCRTEAIQFIGRMHQGMLAPMRYRCIEMPAALPKGAER